MSFIRAYLFENDVKMYGTETFSLLFNKQIPFENDVKMYGTETSVQSMGEWQSLRMM